MDSISVDALVIGSGFGGSIAARALSKAGLETVLLERGDWARRDADDWDPRQIMLRQRYKSESPIRVRQNRDRAFRTEYPNEVVGGMSVFYGGASFRLRERDFTSWPISYDDLEPFYAEAENLLEVHGLAGQDPCEPRRSGDYPFPPIPLTPPAERIRAAATALGLKPFVMPLAINFNGRPARTLCVRCNTCDGFPCKVGAKNDLAETVIADARRHGLRLITGAIAARLIRDRDGDRVAGAECVDRQTHERFTVKAGLVVLSAGALASPVLILRSALPDTPGARLVGRHLMRHCSAVVTGIFPYRTNVDRKFHKQLCLTDFYDDLRDRDGLATGVIQDVYAPEPEVVAHHMPFVVKPLARLICPRMQNLLCMAEDEPNFENRVSLSTGRDAYGLEQAQVEHRYSDADYRRRNHLIARAKKVLTKAGALVTGAFYEIPSFSHAVGTLRFGSSPSTSALDADCRYWGVRNLFVLDGSFMPSSGGINPSLTIAANAARVASRIVSGAAR